MGFSYKLVLEGPSEANLGEQFNLTASLIVIDGKIGPEPSVFELVIRTHSCEEVSERFLDVQLVDSKVSHTFVLRPNGCGDEQIRVDVYSNGKRRIAERHAITLNP